MNTVRRGVPAKVIKADSRSVGDLLKPQSIDAVITSPPYPNEKDYTRTTRLESVILGLIPNKQELRTLKQDLVRSNTRGVYNPTRTTLRLQTTKRYRKSPARLKGAEWNQAKPPASSGFTPG